MGRCTSQVCLRGSCDVVVSKRERAGQARLWTMRMKCGGAARVSGGYTPSAGAGADEASKASNRAASVFSQEEAPGVSGMREQRNKGPKPAVSYNASAVTRILPQSQAKEISRSS